MFMENKLQAPSLRKIKEPRDPQLAECLVPGPGTSSCQESGRPLGQLLGAQKTYSLVDLAGERCSSLCILDLCLPK